MFAAKNSRQSPKSSHNEEKKTINLPMFLCGLNEKKRLNVQSSQNLIIWCPIHHHWRKISDWSHASRRFLFLFLASLVSQSLKFFCLHLLNLFYTYAGTQAATKVFKTTKELYFFSKKTGQQLANLVKRELICSYFSMILHVFRNTCFKEYLTVAAFVGRENVFALGIPTNTTKNT